MTSLKNIHFRTLEWYILVSFVAAQTIRLLNLSIFNYLFYLFQFSGYDRTLSGYHLCNMTESVSETHVISYPTSYTQRKPCGGWLPWTMCDVTVYKTEYRTQVLYMPKQVMKCCHGYEQVGSYCALCEYFQTNSYEIELSDGK